FDARDCGPCRLSRVSGGEERDRSGHRDRRRAGDALIEAVFLDAGDTLLAADPPVYNVYRDAFAAHGVEVDVEAVHRAVHETWREVHAAHDRGEERWGGPGGEAGFWRRFVAAVYARVGGGEMPDPLL